MGSKKDRFLVIYAILCAAIVVLVIALVPMVEVAMQPHKSTSTPEGSFGEVTLKSRYEISVAFGNVTPDVNFTDCRITVITPAGENTTINLVANKYTYEISDDLAKLTELRISDSGATGKVGPEDTLTLYHTSALELGIWTVKLVYKASDGVIASRKVVSNDPDSTPTGSFLTSQLVNPKTYRLTVNQINPPTAYSYCSVLVDPPGTNNSAKTFKLGDRQDQAFFYSSDLKVVVTAGNGDGVVESGDTIELVSTGTHLAYGQWLVALQFDFNGGRILQKIFTISS